MHVHTSSDCADLFISFGFNAPFAYHKQIAAIRMMNVSAKHFDIVWSLNIVYNSCFCMRQS